MRVVLQNISAYITMFVGIWIANVLLLFGLSMLPLTEHYKDVVQNHPIAKYQYTLVQEASTQTKGAEKYAVSELENNQEDITVYGVQKDSKYISHINTVKISQAYAEKYQLKKGDTIKLHKKYSAKTYPFKIDGIYRYNGSLSVFIPIQTYRKMFDTSNTYFNGYFSNHKITDIDSSLIINAITKKDLGKTADQLTNSMSVVMNAISVFAVIMYILIIYVLSKLIIERNADMISMIKILGYNRREIRKIYSGATTWIVILSLALTLPISDMIYRILYQIFMQEMKGWMNYYIASWIYLAIFVIGILSYIAVYFYSNRQINKISMSQIMKNME